MSRLCCTCVEISKKQLRDQQPFEREILRRTYKANNNQQPQHTSDPGLANNLDQGASSDHTRNTLPRTVFLGHILCNMCKTRSTRVQGFGGFIVFRIVQTKSFSTIVSPMQESELGSTTRTLYCCMTLLHESYMKLQRHDGSIYSFVES